jgi:hypothetical protein
MPDNAIYYQAAYAVAAVMYVGYIVSLVVRARRVRRRQEEMSNAGLASGRRG